MRLSALAALMILTTVMLSACGQETVAALDDRSTQFYGRGFVAPRGSTQMAMAYTPPTSGRAYAPILTSVPMTPVTSTVTIDAVNSNDLPPPAHAPMAFSAPKVQTAAANTAWDWPVEGKVIQDFRTQGEGIVIAARKGTPIHAVAAGEVAYVGTQVKEYGNLVIVRHASGEMTSYAHAAEIIVSKGDKVGQGDVLGYVGQTGRAPQPQLHFAVRAQDSTVDPLTRLPQRFALN